jgi:signal peptidase I
VKSRPLGCLIEVVETLVLTIIIFWLVQTFVAQPYRVEQESMRDTLEPDQYVLVDKLTPNFLAFSRGDIIVFFPVTRDGSCSNEPVEPRDPTEPPFIKRVIGLPGDTIDLVAGRVEVNGVALDEPYIRGNATLPISGETHWVVQPDRLFVMGDNRANSTDSRSDQVGEVCRQDVVGKAFLRYWPINTLGVIQTPSYPDVPPTGQGLRLELLPVAGR